MVEKHHDLFVAGIEAGGTKFVCAVGNGPENLNRKEFPTENPAEVLANVTQWLGEQQRIRGKLEAIGIGSFGPLDLDERSQTYGYITSTPKPGWKNVDLVGAIRMAFPGLPVGVDTDENAAALGEYRWGNARGLQDFVYVTLGTGIGGGGMSGGRLIHGLVHPEMGHMLLPRISGDTFAGVCPYHGACWEGLCSGPAIRERTGLPAEDLPSEHELWVIETQYIAHAVANILYVLSPQRIIIGGSVAKAGQLGSVRFFGMIRRKLETALNNYISSSAVQEAMDSFVVPPLQGDNAGILGGIALAQMCID